MEELNTLADAVDQYLAMRSIDKKKYYTSYLISARYVWRYLFKNTIYAVSSQWFTVKKGVPYNYVDVPQGLIRLFSVSTVDKHCNKIIPLFYNNTINILQKPLPSQKKCGCQSCDCGGMCDDVNSLTYTTKVLFTINGVDYIEKTWVKVCPNGDIIEYREVPVKKYNTFAGDPGDYFTDYSNDYLIGNPPFADYTIVAEKFQNTICKLEVRPCGCPTDTPENAAKLNEFCGCFLPFNSCCKKKHCDSFLGEINNNCKGEVKMSECGTKIYYIPHRDEKTIPDFLLVNWQTSGENCDEAVQVPEYANEALWAGIDYYSKRYNNSYSLNEKAESRYMWNDQQNQLIMYLTPLSLQWLSTVQDAKILF